MKTREEIINRLMYFFYEIPEVKAVVLRGSITTNETDRFSDIDIAVDVSGLDNGAFAIDVMPLLQNEFNIEFFDWATSLLPKEYVVSLYLRDSSIFWNIDIQFIAKPHYESLTSVNNNAIHHFLKLLNLKYLQRGHHSKLTLNKLANRCGIENAASAYETMYKIIRLIENNADEKLHNFIVKCDIELENYKNSKLI